MRLFLFNEVSKDQIESLEESLLHLEDCCDELASGLISALTNAQYITQNCSDTLW